jgi:hypothetical protein
VGARGAGPGTGAPPLRDARRILWPRRRPARAPRANGHDRHGPRRGRRLRARAGARRRRHVRLPWVLPADVGGDVAGGRTGTVGALLRWWRTQDLLDRSGSALRAGAWAFSLLAFLVMACNEHGDWRQFERYEEYRLAHLRRLSLSLSLPSLSGRASPLFSSNELISVCLLGTSLPSACWPSSTRRCSYSGTASASLVARTWSPRPASSSTSPETRYLYLHIHSTSALNSACWAFHVPFSCFPSHGICFNPRALDSVINLQHTFRLVSHCHTSLGVN